LLFLGIELSNALMFGGQWLADTGSTNLLGIDLRQPASHRRLAQLHVSEDLTNTQALGPDHVNDWQLEVRVKDASFRFRFDFVTFLSR
jgi:hypothetical protein